MNPYVQKFKKIFIEEAQSLLNSYESDLLQLEKKPDDTSLIESAFRNMHTLKGISGMYGFEFVSELTHKLESIFQAVRDNQIKFDKELFDITFLVIDHLRKLMFDEALSDSSLKQEHQELMELINKSCSSSISANKGFTTSQNQESNKSNSQSIWHILLHVTEKQQFRGICIMNIFKELAEIGYYTIEKLESAKKIADEIWSITLLTSSTEERIREVFLFIEDDCKFVHIADLKEPVFDGDNSISINSQEKELSILEVINSTNLQKKELKPSDEVTPKTSSHESKLIPVDPVKLDHLMFLVSELIVINSQMSLSVKNKNFDAIRSNIEALDALSKNFRNNALDLRLVPLNELVLRFQRLIRDLSKQLGKKLDFQVHGAENELDKSTIEQLSDPLMHIIRNCIDHGIETPDQRKTRGKSETGIIKLTAYHSGGKIIIKIEDDGNGIDLEKVKNKAINMGLLNSTDQITKKELFDFIFLPGFSTAQNLTAISGRGVGMNVVRKKIQDLRGDVIVESEEGIGTSFTLILHQSVSIIDSLLFKVENSYFTVPMSDINICSDINFEEVELRKHTSTIPFGDQLIPFIDIRKKLHLSGQYAKRIKLIIFKNNERMMAILTDKIIGEHQAVLKPLDSFLRKQNLLTSASQIGDGNIAFMIDTNEMMKDIAKV